MFLAQVGVIQASVAEMEEEKKKLQDIITDQTNKLDKMAEDYKMLEGSKQATDKEYQQTLENLEQKKVLHTYKYVCSYVCMLLYPKDMHHN